MHDAGVGEGGVGPHRDSSSTASRQGAGGDEEGLCPFSRARLALYRRTVKGEKGDFSSSPSGEYRRTSTTFPLTSIPS
jgi:hypothetical protein